jgi:hypothetical protein
MRNINADALFEIEKQFGLESILIVRVWWNDTYIDYSDKSDTKYDVQGKVLSISGLDNVLGIDQGSTSSSVSVTLDDSDDSLRTIINNRDIHKTKVQILQWFAGRPKTDAFVLFTGQINTPIQWNEGSRTLEFTVLNMIENLELGFSLEEGIVQGIPVNAYGKAFPLVFGSVLKVPSLQLSESPSGLLAQGFAFVYEDIYEEDIADLEEKVQKLFELARELYLTGIGAEVIALTYNDGFDNAFSPPDNYDTYLAYHDAAQQYFNQSDQYMTEMRNLQRELDALIDDFEQKRAYNFRSVQVASINFPRNQIVTVEIDNTRFRVMFNGVQMMILNEVVVQNERPSVKWVNNITERDVTTLKENRSTDIKFKWFDAGSVIRVISVPMYYAAAFDAVTIHGVYARRMGVRVKVPTNLYTQHVYTFSNSENTAPATIIRMVQPLSTILDANGDSIYDSDEIWCDITGTVGEQFIHQMFWTIAMFTNLQADPTTFNDVFLLTQNTPMNYAILERMNTFDFIKQLCHQARCAVWVEDETVYLRYLPAEPTPVDTITPDDVVEDTLAITCNDTDDVVTKLTVGWRTSLDQENEHKVIVRQNLLRYGVHSEEDYYFALNTHELVQRVAVFWLIRRAILWKKVKFKTFISKLKLESHDAVSLTGFTGLFSNFDVTGIVESAIYDSASNTIDMVIWLPIRWGEMDPYLFAYPAQVQDLWGDPTLEDFRTGNPFENANDDLGLMNQVQSTYISYGPQAPVNRPSHGINISDRTPQFTISTAVLDVTMQHGRPNGFADANDRKKYEIKPPEPIVIELDEDGKADIGTITEVVTDTTYKVQKIAGSVVTARQLRVAEGFQLTVGMPVVIVKKAGIWYMQSPVWAPEDEDE